MGFVLIPFLIFISAFFVFSTIAKRKMREAEAERLRREAEAKKAAAAQAQPVQRPAAPRTGFGTQMNASKTQTKPTAQTPASVQADMNKARQPVKQAETKPAEPTKEDSGALRFDGNDAVRGILFAEILGKPKALR